MTSGIRLGRVFGAPVVADISALVLVLLFGVAVLLDLRSSGIGNPGTNWVVALVAGLAVLASVLVHELSHAVVAVSRRLHVRSIRLYLFGGYSVIDGSPSPGTEILVSLSGPITSIAVGSVLWYWSEAVGRTEALGRALYAVALANLAIGLFNLLPGFPLDGGRILRGLLSAGGRDRVLATRIVTTIGRWIGWAAIVIGAVMLVRRQPIGVFAVVVGWYLTTTAVRAGRREQLSTAFDGVSVRDAMRSTPEALSANSSVATAVELYMLGPRMRAMPVELDGRIVGILGQEEVDSVAPARWPQMRVRALMSEIGPADVVEAGAPLETLFVGPGGPHRRVVVVDDDIVVGIVDGADLARVMEN